MRTPRGTETSTFNDGDGGGDDGGDEDNDYRTAVNGEDATLSRASIRPSRETWAISCTLALALLTNFAFYASELPLIRLAQRMICEAHYTSHVSLSDSGWRSEGPCQIPQVQDRVAIVIGCKAAFDAIPPLLTSLWYGALADRLGRRPVIALACSGELLSLLGVIVVGFFDRIRHIEYIWLTAPALFIGGGQFVLNAMFSIILIDIVPEEKRLNWLSILHSLTLLNVLFATPIAAALMKQSLWSAFVVILGISALRYTILWALPETGSQMTDTRLATFRKTSPQTVVGSGPTEPLLNTPRPDPRPRPSITENLTVLARLNGVLFCFMCFMAKRIAFTSEFLMFQYTSEILGIPLEDTAWIRIPLGLGASIVTILCLPLLFRALQARSRQRNDMVWELRAVRFSLSILMLGFGLYWFASARWTMIIALLLCGAGEGLAPCLQAVTSSLVPSDSHTDLFATISLIDTSAKLLGGPVMGAAFSIRNQHGQTYGFCFMLSMVLFSIMYGFSWTLSIDVAQG